MQISQRPIPTTNSTLSKLITELGRECQNITALVNQFQLSHLSTTQQAQILADLLAAVIHLQTQSDEEFQSLIAEELEKLPDDDEE